MNDLISKSALIDALKIHFDSCFREDGELFYSDHICTSDDVVDLIKLVENQPTAYDIDKVVERLELHSFEFGTDTLPVHYVRLNDAIEIVKQGGVSEASDNVCEWKYTKEIMDNAEFKVGCNTNVLKRGVVPNNFSYHDFKYCPYCSKKIKVVK